MWIGELVSHLDESAILESAFESTPAVSTPSSDSEEETKWPTNSDSWIRRNSENEDYSDSYSWGLRSQVRPSNSTLLEGITSSLTELTLNDTTEIQDQESVIMDRPEPTFTFCGCFSGKGAISAARWLKKLEHELNPYKENGVIPPGRYMDSINLLLTDDAAEWAETNAEAAGLLSQEDPTPESVTAFRNLFQERFPAKTVETSNTSFDTELGEMKQKPDETINSYHKRLLALMLRYGVKDRPLAGSLSLLESAILDVIMKTFVRGLLDDEVRKETIRGLSAAGRSLRGLCSLAEDADRSKKEFQKLMEEENKSRELEFYKDMVQRSMPKDRLEAMLASYRAGPIPTDWMQTNPFSQNPPKYERSQTAPPPAAVTKPAPLGTSTGTGNLLPPETLKAASYPPQPRWNGFSNRNFFHKPTPRELPAASTSKNSYVNGSKVWAPGSGALCVKCGETGHISKDCNGIVLPAWEQSYLRSIVFGDTPQANFCIAGYGAYDGNVLPYEERPSEGSSQYHPEPSSSKTGAHASGSVSSVTYGVSGDILSGDNLLISPRILPTPVRSASVDAFYGEGSGPNKRPHMEFAIPGPGEGKSGRKGKRTTGTRKKADPQPLVGMFNDTTGTYDKPVSVRQVLKDNKVDMSLLDFMAWSPEACREMKRLATKVTKKRAPKVTFKIPEPAPGQSSTFQPGVTLPPLNFNMPQSRTMLPPLAQGGPSTFQPNIPGQINVPVQTHFPPQGQNPVQSQYIPQYQVPQQPIIQQSIPQQPPVDLPGGEVLGVRADADCHTRFLSSLKGMAKVFRIECTVQTNGESVTLGKATTQADQGSEMNVISEPLREQLGIPRKKLSDIGFHGLTMRTADFRDTPLEYWVELLIMVSEISRTIRCFVSPGVSIPGSARSGHYSLLLGLPWLFSVNAVIHIRESKITIGDPVQGESTREIVGPEMTFCTEHTLIMYSVEALSKTYRPKEEEDDSSDSSSGDESSGDDLSDVDDEVHREDF